MRSTASSRSVQRSHSRSPSKTLTPKKSPAKSTSSIHSHLPPVRPVAVTVLSPASRARLLHSLHLQHNGRLMMEIEKEEQRELRREVLLVATHDAGERWRLEGSFGLERGEAMERLGAVKLECERQMALKMQELGMIGGWHDDARYSGEWEEKRQMSPPRKSGRSTGRARV